MRFILLILLSFTGIRLVAQDSNPLPNWDYVTFPGNQNTDYSDNKYIMKDSLGYIWTYNSSSIERFDGFKFKSYFTYDEFNSDNDVRFVYRMYCSKKGVVYALSSTGLFFLNRKTDSFDKLMDGFVPYQEGIMPDFTSMVERDGIIYIGSFVGLYEFNPSKQSWTFYDLTPDIEHKNAHHSKKVIWYIAEDEYEPHLINIFGKALFSQFDTNEKKITKSIAIGEFKNLSIHKTSQVGPNKFFLSTFGSGVLKLDTKKEETIIYLNESSQIINDKQFRATHSSGFVNGHYISTSTTDPIAFIDTSTNEVKYFKSLGEKQFDFVSFDDRIYWCTIFKGLVKLEELDHQIYPVNLPKEKSIRKVKPNNSETLVGIHGVNNYLSFYDIKNDAIIYLDSIKSSLNLIHDEYTDEYLVEISKGRFLVYNAEDLEFKRELDLQFDASYYNYIISNSNYTFNNHGSLNIYSKDGQLAKSIKIPEKYYTYLQLTNSWISTFDDNHVILQNPSYFVLINIETGTFKEYPEFRNQGLIGSYTLDGKSLYTIKTRNGIVKYTYDIEKDTFIHQPLEYKLTAYTSHQNILFNDSLIWLRCKDNIKIFNMKTERYQMEQNFPIAQYSFYNKLSVSPSGMWTCGSSEIIKINAPTWFKQIESINLESIESNNRIITQRNNIKLEPSATAIKFNWSSPYYGKARTINYYTRLEGRDDRWENVGENQNKLYLGLTPGKYTFHVKASAPGSNILKQELISFEILPHWYRTWWFYLLVALLTIGALYCGYKYRLHTITKKNKLDRRIAQLELKALKAQLNPHFIFNSLNSIKRLIQKNENKIAIEYLLLFSSMIRNVLDLSDKKSVTLREELDFSEKYLKMEKLRFQKNFEYEIYSDDDYFLDDYSLPAMILQPHLENAIWHGIMPLEDRKGKVLVNVFENEEFITIRIEDNGIGREESSKINARMTGNIHKSKGQSLSIDRLKLTSLSREQQITTEIIDKDPQGDNPGTIINIKLKK